MYCLLKHSDNLLSWKVYTAQLPHYSIFISYLPVCFLLSRHTNLLDIPLTHHSYLRAFARAPLLQTECPPLDISTQADHFFYFALYSSHLLKDACLSILSKIAYTLPPILSFSNPVPWVSYLHINYHEFIWRYTIINTVCSFLLTWSSPRADILSTCTPCT